MKSISALSFLTAACVLSLFSAPADAKILAQWVQLGPDGDSSARAISDGACPQATIDGVTAPMRVRAEPDAKFTNVPAASFSVRSCEARLPEGTKSASIDGKPLPLPKPNPQRIMIFGDSGCRIDKNKTQECNDADAWPFPKIVATAAAAKPDLVIHVGDYHYREAPCPAGNAGCAGSPYGYGWDVWNADFFGPAEPLLATAPWVMVRGNHEDCVRAAEGWFRFLDRAPVESGCRDLTGMFVAKMGDFGVLVFDGAATLDPKEPNKVNDALHSQLRDIAAKVPSETWLATHVPLDAATGNAVTNKLEEAALGTEMPLGVRMYVSGHIHFFQAMDFGGLRPPQLVVGTGGDWLEQQPKKELTGTEVNGLRAVQATTYSGFGYMIWDKKGTQWSGVLFDPAGKPLGSCKLDGRSIACGGS